MYTRCFISRVFVIRTEKHTCVLVVIALDQQRQYSSEFKKYTCTSYVAAVLRKELLSRRF